MQHTHFIEIHYTVATFCFCVGFEYTSSRRCNPYFSILAFDNLNSVYGSNWVEFMYSGTSVNDWYYDCTSSARPMKLPKDCFCYPRRLKIHNRYEVR